MKHVPAPYASSESLSRFAVDSIWIAIPLVVALVAFVLALLPYPLPPAQSDAMGYSMTALRIIQDHVYMFGAEPPGTPVSPNAIVTPGYPLFLAAFYLLVPGAAADPTAAISRTQPYIVFVQLLMALVIVWCIGMIGKSLGGKRLGTLSGLAAAIYLPFGWAASVALAEQVGTALFSLLLLMAINFSRKSANVSPVRMLLFGVLAGVMTMMRPALVLWPVVPITFIFLRRLVTFRQMAIIVASAGLGLLLVLAPWWVRNVPVTGHFKLLRSGAAVLPPIAPRAKPSVLGPSVPVPGFPVQLTREVQTQACAGRTMPEVTRIAVLNPWVPPLATIWEDVYSPNSNRVGFAQPATYSPEKLIPAVAFVRAYQWLLIVLAVVALFFVRRSPRLLILASVPVYTIWIHYSIQVNMRYFYPATPALVALASAGAYGVWGIAMAAYSKQRSTSLEH